MIEAELACGDNKLSALLVVHAPLLINLIYSGSLTHLNERALSE